MKERETVMKGETERLKFGCRFTKINLLTLGFRQVFFSGWLPTVAAVVVVEYKLSKTRFILAHAHTNIFYISGLRDGWR